MKKNRKFGGKPRHSKKSENGFWIFGTHAVGEALQNDKRNKKRLVLSENAYNKLQQVVEKSKIVPEIVKPSVLNNLLEDTVHQGVALLVDPLDPFPLETMLSENIDENTVSILLFLDGVTDPHNIGAILRSAHVFGIKAVVTAWRHAPGETGVMAKSASGAMEHVPYVRVKNLSQSLALVKEYGYLTVCLDQHAGQPLETADCKGYGGIVLVLGAEGCGTRSSTQLNCDVLHYIPPQAAPCSLNVSNAAAIAMYIAKNLAAKAA
jgi:23S rRNA (guanosine2251-2'-O)-methyltransferase